MWNSHFCDPDDLLIFMVDTGKKENQGQPYSRVYLRVLGFEFIGKIPSLFEILKWPKSNLQSKLAYKTLKPLNHSTKNRFI